MHKNFVVPFLAQNVALSLAVQSISKSFSGRPVLRAVSFTAHEGGVIGIAGRNGAGKTTLAKIIGGLLTPDNGTVALARDEAPVARDELYRHIGYVAPYVALYDEFTPRELLRVTANLRGIAWRDGETERMIEYYSLTPHIDRAIHGFSSGMMQRMRLATALQHEPSLLILDEPTTNLDAAGAALVREIVERQRQRGIVLLATNNAAELAWCSSVVNVEADPSMAREQSSP